MTLARVTMKRLLLLLLWLPQLPAFAADYAREQRWTDEILPGLVVGEPDYLAANPTPLMLFRNVRAV